MGTIEWLSKVLLCRRGKLSLDSQRQGGGASSVIPALQRQQEEPDRRNPGLGVVGWLVSVAKSVSSRFGEVFCLKKTKWRVFNTQCKPVAHTRVYMCTCTYMNMYIHLYYIYTLRKGKNVMWLKKKSPHFYFQSSDA